VLTAVILRRFTRRRFRFESVQEFTLFCLWAVVLLPAASAVAGATARHALGFDFWTACKQWFMGDALAHLIITPAIFYWVLGAPWKERSVSPRRGMEAALLTLGLVGTGYLAFDTPSGWLTFAEPRFYAPVPFLFWAAIRFGMLGATGAIAVIAFFSVESALLGRGPFTGQSPVETALALQHFLLLRAAPLYLIAILSEQRNGVERSLRQQRDEIAQLSRVAAVGELSGSLAHELSQPLTAILTNAQAAEYLLERDRAEPAMLREILRDIVSEDRRAADIIQRLRGVFERGDVQNQPIEINELVRDALKLAHGELAREQVDVRTELGADIPAITGDRVQLQQLLVNLITNACAAMSDQAAAGRRLVVRSGSIGREGVRVSVCDSGHGISPGDLTRIFEPFFTTRLEGMGLGLTVCRTIISAHRGKLWAENNADSGASFHVVLPFSETAPD
jgi:signal transduction histidine kinase